MQKIIKPRNSGKQLLETDNFALIKIFDSLVKIAVVKAFLPRSRVQLRLQSMIQISQKGEMF